MGIGSKALKAKVALLRNDKSGGKRKVEVGSGSDSASLTKVQRIEVSPASSPSLKWFLLLH